MIKEEDVLFERNGLVVAHVEIHKAFKAAREKNPEESFEPYAQLLYDIFIKELKGKHIKIKVGTRGGPLTLQMMVSGIKFSTPVCQKDGLCFVEIIDCKDGEATVFAETEIRILIKPGFISKLFKEI